METVTSKPHVFLSYSLSKSHLPKLVGKVIQIVKNSIEARGWKCIDPMADAGISSVSKKVESGLRLADAMIVECSTNTPNVMFEIGFARALGYPIILITNTDAPNAESLHEYFKFLKLSAANPLSADLGDVEYLAYTDDFSDPAADSFRQTLTKVLDKASIELTSDRLHLTRSRKRLHDQFAALLDAHATQEDEPLLRFLGGWACKVTDDLAQGERDGFDVDSDYYDRCFDDFGDLRKTGLAIADLTDPTEKFWLEDSEKIHLPVRERIFVVSKLALLNSDLLSQIVHRLSEHKTRENHDYKLLIAPLWPEKPSSDKLFGAETSGHHMLIIDPNMTVGYVRRNDRAFLRVTRKADIHKKAYKLYRKIKEVAFEFKSDEKELRRVWLEREGIGRWNPTWNTVHGPTTDYYEKYDLNIRCWIPDYKLILNHTADIVLSELRQTRSSQQRDAGGNIVLEVGCGTGALTEVVLNRLMRRPNGERSRLLNYFLATDKSTAMIERAKKRLTENTHLEFEQLTAFGSPGEKCNRWKFHLICGSLVLHDIIRDTPSLDGLIMVLKQCATLLREKGIIVFADSFVRGDGDYDRNSKYWYSWMKSAGLSDEEVTSFMSNNQDMLRTATEDQMKKAAEASGFGPPRFIGIPGAAEDSPFQILVMQMK